MAGAGQPGPRLPAGRRRGWVSYWVLLAVAAVALAGGVATDVITMRTFSVPTDSMDNTVRAGDVVMVSTTAPVRRGAVVVEEQPGGGDHVRRVIALPGDHVACCDAAGRVTVSGIALHETYLPRGTVPSRTRFSATVPRGKLWLMGDNRGIAYDSRVTGPVAAHVVGAVFLILRSGHLILGHPSPVFTAAGLAPAGQPVPPGLIGTAVALAGLIAAVALAIIGAVAAARRSRRPRRRRPAD